MKPVIPLLGCGIVPPVALKTNGAAGRVFSAHVFQMLGQMNLAKAVRHADHRRMTREAGLAVFGHIQIECGTEISVPILGRRKLDVGIDF